MIKPEDIPDTVVKAMVWEIARNGEKTLAQIASIAANAMIEAGVVSPPVYTVRDNHGNLLDDEVYGLWATPDAAESQHKEDYTAEHWKGQTE